MDSIRFFCRRWSIFIFVLLSLLSAQHILAAPQTKILDTNQGSDSVEATLAELSDEQVRQLLIAELKKDALQENGSFSLVNELQGPSAPLALLLNGLETESVQSVNKLQQLYANVPHLLPDIKNVFITLCPLGTPQGAMINFAWIIIFLSIGLVFEQVTKKIVIKKYFTPSRIRSQPMRQGLKLFASTIIKLPDLIGVAIFFCVSYLAFLVFDHSGSAFVRLVFYASIITLGLIRVISIFSAIILSPQVAGFRILPLECRSAKIIHSLIVGSFAYIVSALMLVVVFHRLGAPRQTIISLQLFFATALLLVTAIIVVMSKNAVRNYITHKTHTTDEIPWGLEQFASIWHFLALLYLLVLWLLLVQSISIEGDGSKNAFILSFFVLPIWMIADKIAGWLVLYAMSTLKIYDENACPDGSDPAQVELHVKGKKLYLSSRFAARILVVVILGIWIAGLWNITIPFISKLGSVATDALIIMTLAMFFWRFVSSWIESKINETGHETEKNNQGNDNEWGAVARGRSYTLLPMIRKFIASVLVIMVTMTILSSLGVDIGPLLAGAGVVGLAVGFGAQKLVADMFSGFFYLLDDAFRVGEYLQAGSVSGTVESIKLRNIMLRNHRGMLQKVPHSELGPITNFMRGGIIVKFNLDFNYNADIEKIRKIIKKVGIAMLEDEEIGGDFIQPVKSQGVREISNSVMTIRVKFTAKPGTHFVIRREAYRRITESLQKNGIEYAKKQVIVDVPGLSRRNGEPELTPGEVEKIVDAAGGAARILEEQEAEKFPGKKELS